MLSRSFPLWVFTLFFQLIVFSTEARVREVSAAVGEWPPYIYCDSGAHGVLIDVVRAAYAEVAVSASFECFPWARSFSLTREGVYDTSFPWSRSAERQKIFYFSEPVISDYSVFFHLKNRSFPKLSTELNIENLSPYKIGGTIGYYYGPLLEEFDEKFGLQRAKSDELNFKKLLRGRIDLFPINFQVGYYLLSKLPPNPETG
ncbi:substrate-binding periplasmic protein [Dongshaea marina]|uniref:substrate-binding periplasmic protein n=1 Tax=Dongshaea marina TaxID=2047966 RepID=UPI000D3E1F12|nr:transporter substrate-binding domain-containing protein [Dongshaea marina]